MDAGIVISASHNPMRDNGIKFFAGDGFKLPDEVESEIENCVDTADHLPRNDGAGVGRMYHTHDLEERYLAHLKETLPFRLDGVKAVLDCSNGAVAELAPRLFAELGADVTVIHNEPNGVNINAGCGSLHTEQLQELVLRTGANLGMAFDGDGDRAILVDEKGRTVDGDHVMAICALHLAAAGQLPHNSVVATVMSNMGLEVALKQHGITLLRTRVGDRYVCDEMRKTGIIVGGEKSGHLIFSDLSTTGDGMITALKVLGIMIETGEQLSSLADQMREFPQVLHNIPVRDKDGWERIPEIHSAILGAQETLSGRGRLFVRASGTERLIRVMAEGPDLAELQQIALSISSIIRAQLG
jgi:phosphoglucosamine mutase